jgi:hypothetical protein
MCCRMNESGERASYCSDTVESASAVVSLPRKLERAGILVTLTIQIDSVAKPFQNDWLIPANVLESGEFLPDTWADSRSPQNRACRSGAHDNPW